MAHDRSSLWPGRSRRGVELGLVRDRKRRGVSHHGAGRGCPRRRGPALRRNDRCRDHRSRHRAQRRCLVARVQGGRGLRHPRPGDGAATTGTAGETRSAGGRRMNTYYAANLLIYAGVDIIAVLALNLQFGVSGIVNFSFIVFQAAGAYAAAVLSMPPHTAADYSFQVYVGGYQLPFPIPWIGGALAGALLAIPVGLVVLRKLRSDYQAIALLVTSIIANTVINNARPFLNGAAGLALVPQPLENQVDTGTDNYLYLYIGLTAVCVGLVWFLAARIVNSPYGRTLRAMRGRALAATALGETPVAVRTPIVIGGR